MPARFRRRDRHVAVFLPTKNLVRVSEDIIREPRRSGLAVIRRSRVVTPT